MRCRRAGILLERRTSGLAEADALRLEEHLAGCAACSDDARVLEALITDDEVVRSRRPASSGLRALERALDRAPASAPERSWNRARAAVAIGLAAATAAALIIAFWPDPAPVSVAQEPAVVRAPPAPTPTADRVESGALLVDGRLHGPGAAVVADRPLLADGESRLALAHAGFDVAAGSSLVWNPDHRTLRLQSGSVRVTVDPGPHRLIRVATERFVVEVLGTSFAVDPGGVEVTSGTVRVVDPDGRVLAASLVAGERWQVADREAVDARPVPAAPDVATLLARARSLLAAGDVAGARTAAAAALARRPRAANAAEARTLLAECALTSGKPRRAIQLYVEVSKRHRDLPAGETALFLAGRIAADSGDPRAIEYLGSYLDRYPTGRFRAEASRRITSLRDR